MTPTDKAAIEGLIEAAGMLGLELSTLAIDEMSPEQYALYEAARAATPALQRLLAGETREAAGDYRGMEYPLEQLPAIWRTLAGELRENAKESKADDPELARCFEMRGISIISCAEQLKWSLAHPAQPPAQVDAGKLAEDIIFRLHEDGYFNDGNGKWGCSKDLEAVILPIIKQHTLPAAPSPEGENTQETDHEQ